MAADLSSIIIGAVSGQTLPAVWNMIPEGVKNRCGQGFDRLTGKFTHRWDREDKKENADVNDSIKREDHKSEAQKHVLELLVPDIAKKISADPDSMERAIIDVMGDAYRKQKNKDAVAEEASKDISEKYTNSSDTNEALDEDWLNFFLSYAEKATSEHARQLWGRIFSGEIRHPGRFSISTLRLLSEIDQKTAQHFVKISSFLMGGAIYFPKEYKSKSFSDLLKLENAGLINGITAPLVSVFRDESAEFGRLIDEEFMILVKTNKKNITELRINAIFLTDVGRELIKIIDKTERNPDKISKIEETLKENISVSGYFIHKIINRNENELSFETNPISSWERE